ncbi:SGNH/GDSL hydrolase family protein [Arthrobacter sp. efr-133-TYG-120]|uniref:SGNH/GDSL hydrolase family protein n=1 Tax=Arthrobacter sp. efr-133-TYG-120 TaxID=3040280 RepID=UPI00254DB369|nr:SGNH/GDSL hydrolase family protein [Arthrobacter sp. efr-133-TYG-120]
MVAGNVLDADQNGRRRFVALGDSFTEGVGDRNEALPNGVRGWADRVAEKLAKAEPGWEYANLAVRSKRLRHIVDEQLDRALAMEPTLITLYAGGNDILDFGTDMDILMAEYERLVARLASTGATLVLFTGYDVKVSAVLEPFKKRNALYNERVRELAAKYGAVLVDYWCLDAYHDRRMWASDRLHMSKAGHKYMASQVLDHLGVPHKFSPKDWEPPQRLKLRDWERRQRRWVNDWVLPLFGRKLRGVTLGDALGPRWPEPVKVPRKAGLRKLAERQAAAAGSAAAGTKAQSNAQGNAQGKAQNNGGT